MKCSICGESIPAGQAEWVNDKPVCVFCIKAGQPSASGRFDFRRRRDRKEKGLDYNEYKKQKKPQGD